VENYTETFRVRYQRSVPTGPGVVTWMHGWEDITEEEYLMYKMNTEENVVIRKIIMVPTEKEVEIERLGDRPAYGIYGTGIGGIVGTYTPPSVTTGITTTTNTLPCTTSYAVVGANGISGSTVNVKT